MAQPKRTTSYEDYKNKKRMEEEKKMHTGLDRKSEQVVGSLPQKDKKSEKPEKSKKAAQASTAMHARTATQTQKKTRHHDHEGLHERRRGGGIVHLILGILVGLFLVSLAFAIPHFLNQKNTDIAEKAQDENTGEVVTTLEDIVFPDEAARIAEEVGDEQDSSDEKVDGDGVATDEGAVANDVQNGDESENIEDNGGIDGTGNNSGTGDTKTTPEPTPEPAPEPEPEPVTPQYGTWQLLYMNTEKFELDDEDDDVTEIEIKDVCESIYNQNASVVSYCDKTSKLRKTTSSNLGKSRCEGDGGSCRYGRTCLLWNDKEDDDGDVKLYTAMYRCE